jgi:hypothetical protein
VVWSVIAPNVSNSMVAAFVQLFVPSPTIASFDVLTNVFIYSNAFFQSNPFLSCLYIHTCIHTMVDLSPLEKLKTTVNNGVDTSLRGAEQMYLKKNVVCWIV